MQALIHGLPNKKRKENTCGSHVAGLYRRPLFFVGSLRSRSRSLQEGMQGACDNVAQKKSKAFLKQMLAKMIIGFCYKTTGEGLILSQELTNQSPKV